MRFMEGIGTDFKVGSSNTKGSKSRIPLFRTPRYHIQFSCSHPYIFLKINPLNKDTFD